MKTVAELFREQDLQAYSKHPKIAPKFGKEYKTEISFGIHTGYSIEGSIGTDMKVDALFISPDAMIAYRIEQLNSVYGTTILMSGEFYDLLSPKGQQQVRHIDCCFIKEAQGNLKNIYCFGMKPIEPIKAEEDDEDEI